MELDEVFEPLPSAWPFGYGLIMTEAGLIERGDAPDAPVLGVRIMAIPDGYDKESGHTVAEAIEYFDIIGGPQTTLTFKNVAAVRDLIATLETTIEGYEKYLADRAADKSNG